MQGGAVPLGQHREDPVIGGGEGEHQGAVPVRPDPEGGGLPLPGEDRGGVFHRQQVFGIGGFRPGGEEPPESKDKVRRRHRSAVRPGGVLPEGEGVGAAVGRDGVALGDAGGEGAVLPFDEEALEHIGGHQLGGVVGGILGVKGAGGAAHREPEDKRAAAAAGKSPDAEECRQQQRKGPGQTGNGHRIIVPNQKSLSIVPQGGVRGKGTILNKPRKICGRSNTKRDRRPPWGETFGPLL